MLTQDQLKEVLHYCPETGVFTRIAGPRKGRQAGSAAKNPNTGKTYCYLYVHKHLYLAHRLAFLYVNGQFPKHTVDHQDGNGLNNTWGNLRTVSHAENNKNMRKYSTNTSGVTGVSWAKARRQWYASIRLNCQLKNLGYFSNKEDAIAARKAAEVLYGFHENHGTERPL
jgi:hypothetical protein